MSKKNRSEEEIIEALKRMDGGPSVTWTMISIPEPDDYYEEDKKQIEREIEWSLADSDDYEEVTRGWTREMG